MRNTVIKNECDIFCLSNRIKINRFNWACHVKRLELWRILKRLIHSRIVLIPCAGDKPSDRGEYDRVSKRDRLGLTPDLTTSDLWRRRRWTREGKWEILSIHPCGTSRVLFTCRKILRHGIFPLYFPTETKVCCGFLSPLKIHRLGRVWTRDACIQWPVH
jgi:hypothetical protein